MDEQNAAAGLPETIESEDQLEELLSRPTPEVVDLFARLEGDLAVIGGGGKIGPSLVRMACRAREAAGGDQRITVVDRFLDPGVSEALAAAGVDGAHQVDPIEPQPHAHGEHVVHGGRLGEVNVAVDHAVGFRAE